MADNFIDNEIVSGPRAALPAVPATPELGEALYDVQLAVTRAVSIMSFGADPTGTNDCYPAITSALAALPSGGIIHFPSYRQTPGGPPAIGAPLPIGSWAIAQYSLQTSIEIPANVVLAFDTSMLVIGRGVTLTICGAVDAPPTAQCFSFSLHWIVSPLGTPPMGSVIITKGFRSVGWFGAVADGVADDTVAIRRAMNSIPSGFDKSHPPCKLFFPAAPLGYKVSSTLDFSFTFNLSIEFEVPVFQEQSGSVYSRHQLQWYGNKKSAVLQFAGAMDGLRLDNLSINGNAGADMALFGVAFNTAGFDGVEACKCLITNHLRVSNCRFGVLIGGNSADSDDISNHVHNQMFVDNCSDVGVVVNSGDAGGIQFNSPYFQSNGASPTDDHCSAKIGADGLGYQFMCISGSCSLFEGVSVGSPKNGGLFIGQDINISGWWSEDIGVGLKISANKEYTKHVNIAGFRHYSGSMTEANTPVSVSSDAPYLTLTSCYWFGNVCLETGQCGSCVASGQQFYSGDQRPAQAGFTGSLVTTKGGLILLGDRGENTGILVGGHGLRPMGPATRISCLAGFSGVGVGIELLGPDAGDSGFSIAPANPATGAGQLLVNCYLSAPGSPASYRAYTPGVGIIYSFLQTGQIQVLSYNFPNTTNPVLGTAFNLLKTL